MAMSAKEAAEWVNNHEDYTDDQVLDLVPRYSNALPRRAWFKTFMDHLKKDLAKKFSHLK